MRVTESTPNSSWWGSVARVSTALLGVWACVPAAAGRAFAPEVAAFAPAPALPDWGGPALAPAPWQPPPLPATALQNNFSPGVGNVQYYGGAILPNVSVSTVFWDNSAVAPEAINTFLADITQSSYMSLLPEYSTPSQTIGNGNLAATLTLPAVSNASSIAMTDIISAAIANGSLPQPNANSLYFLFMPPGANDCSMDWCAYHDSYSLNQTPVAYAAIFDANDCKGCSWGNTFQSATSVTSHELAEAITDPYSHSWLQNISNPDSEIADICLGATVKIDGYTVQQLWSNQAKRCLPASHALSIGDWIAIGAAGGVGTVILVMGVACLVARRRPAALPAAV